MTLIDREELLKQYNGNILTAQTDYAQGCRDVIEDINHAIIIDAIPREWLLNRLNARLEFLKRCRDGMPDFKRYTEIKIEDCEEIIDIIKLYENTYNKT